MKFDGADWKSVGTPGFTPGLAHHSSFALGKGDTVYFAYSDGTAMSTGAAMMYDGTQWQSIGTVLTNGACQNSSIVVNKVGKVFFSAVDMSTGQLVIKQYDGNNTWSNVGGGNAIVSGPAGYPFMDLDGNDVIHIAYTDRSAAPGMVRVKKFDGTNWVNVGSPFLSVTGNGAGPAQDIGMAFGPNNEVYVAYSHTFQGPPKTSVQRFDGTNWIVVGTAQFGGTSGAPGLFNRIVVDKQGVPFVILQDYGIGLKASVLKYNGTQWEYVGGQSISDGTSAHTSIALDGNGNPYALFFDEANGLKNTVKRFTVCEAPGVPDVTASEAEICIGDSVHLSAAGPLNDATEWTWYEDACSGTPVGSGTTVTVSPRETKTYYVRGLGGCVNVGDCKAVTINVTASRDLGVMVSVEGFTLSTSDEFYTYQWMLNDAVIPGANNSTYVVAENGNYRVIVTTTGGCVDTSDNYPVNNVSVADFDVDGKIRVYPNPAQEYVHIQAAYPLNIQLFSIEGKLIRTAKEGYQLFVGDVAQGLYLLQATDSKNNIKAVEKLIID